MAVGYLQLQLAAIYWYYLIYSYFILQYLKLLKCIYYTSNVAINSVQFIIPKNQGFKCDNVTYFTYFTNAPPFFNISSSPQFQNMIPYKIANRHFCR